MKETIGLLELSQLNSELAISYLNDTVKALQECREALTETLTLVAQAKERIGCAEEAGGDVNEEELRTTSIEY